MKRSVIILLFILISLGVITFIWCERIKIPNKPELGSFENDNQPGRVEARTVGYIWTMLSQLGYRIYDINHNHSINNKDFYEFIRRDIGSNIEFKEDNPFSGYLPPASYGYCIEAPEGSAKSEIPLIWWPRTTYPFSLPTSVRVVFWSGEKEAMSRPMLEDLLSKLKSHKIVN